MEWAAKSSDDPLNSNLILLILLTLTDFFDGRRTLNSINTDGHGDSHIIIIEGFKFQSDSINTLMT